MKYQAYKYICIAVLGERNYSGRQGLQPPFRFVYFQSFQILRLRAYTHPRRNNNIWKRKPRDSTRHSKGAGRRETGTEDCLSSAERGQRSASVWELPLIYFNISFQRQGADYRPRETSGRTGRSWTHRSRNAYVVKRHSRRRISEMREWFPTFPRYRDLYPANPE